MPIEYVYTFSRLVELLTHPLQQQRQYVQFAVEGNQDLV